MAWGLDFRLLEARVYALGLGDGNEDLSLRGFFLGGKAGPKGGARAGFK